MRYFCFLLLCIAPISALVQLYQAGHNLNSFIALLAAVNVACCLCYKIDKKRAGTPRRRIPESTLHTLELLGGWPAGLLGQWHFRHKTRKLSYQIKFWCIVSIYQILAAYYLFHKSLPNL